MGANSGIEWTHHTFNPWRGCVKVSPACAHCYAETWAKRTGKPIWGPHTQREHAAESYWNGPRKWDAQALEAGERRRVFCASLADVFEDRNDVIAARLRLFSLIEATPNLDWLLLTKRPENMLRFAPAKWEALGWPKNVWAGTTVENQEVSHARLTALSRVPAAVRFISAEPLLGPLEIQGWLGEGDIDWVICGGESGGKARPMQAEWARSLLEQCRTAGVPFLFKQWGEWAPFVRAVEQHDIVVRPLPDGQMARIGKTQAGRQLDGKTWDEYPATVRA